MLKNLSLQMMRLLLLPFLLFIPLLLLLLPLALVDIVDCRVVHYHSAIGVGGSATDEENPTTMIIRRLQRNLSPPSHSPANGGGGFFSFPVRLSHVPSSFSEAIFESGMFPIDTYGNNDWQPRERGGDDDDDDRVIVAILTSLNWTQAENQLVERLAERWQFERLLNFFYAKVLELPADSDERSSALALFERYGPPKSLVHALEAMTTEQKGHVQQLFEANGRRRRRARADLRKIGRGLVASLPDENQAQAERFIQMANRLLHLW